MHVNCKNCVFGSSIEDFEECMARTIDKIIQAKKVGRIVLSEAREYEYDYNETKMLVEIAQVFNKLLNEDKIISISKVGNQQCQKCYQKRMAELQNIIINMIRRDPIGAYVKVNREIRMALNQAEQSHPMCQKCYNHYIENALMPIRDELDKTQLIQILLSFTDILS